MTTLNLYQLEPKDKTLQSAAEATGDGVVFNLAASYGLLRLQIVGITSATITFESSNDGGTTWDAIPGINQETGASALTATADGTFEFNVLAVKKFRARISTYVSGTINAYATAVPMGAPNSNKVTAELSGRKVAVGMLKTTYADAVVADGNAAVTITPTAGFIGRLKTVGYYAPAVAGSTGNHIIRVSVNQAAFGYGAYDIYSVSGVGTSALNMVPATAAPILKDMVFSVDNPLTISYIAPGTNPQAGTRAIFVLWEEEAVVA